MAYDAGANVINLSLGSVNSWGKGNPENEIVNKIVAAGVNVVISAGNSGAEGIYTVGQPSTATSAFSVASIDNQYQKSASLTATGISHSISYVAGGTDTIKNGDVAMSDITSASTSDACTVAQISTDVKGKIALIQRGTCTFAIKVANAATAGASGVIFYNNVDGSISVSAPGAAVPVVGISNADGKAIVSALKNGSVSVKFDKDGVVPSKTGGTVSYFSSTGAEAELNCKPSIAGVGGSIYSTLPSYLGSWGLMSVSIVALIFKINYSCVIHRVLLWPLLMLLVQLPCILALKVLRDKLHLLSMNNSKTTLYPSMFTVPILPILLFVKVLVSFKFMMLLPKRPTLLPPKSVSMILPPLNTQVKPLLSLTVVPRPFLTN